MQRGCDKKMGKIQKIEIYSALRKLLFFRDLGCGISSLTVDKDVLDVMLGGKLVSKRKGIIYITSDGIKYLDNYTNPCQSIWIEEARTGLSVRTRRGNIVTECSYITNPAVPSSGKPIKVHSLSPEEILIELEEENVRR